MADFMCMHIYLVKPLWQISCVCIFSQAFMADFMCMHIQSSLHGRFHVYAYSVKPLWRISCVCIFSQALMTDFSGRFHMYAFSQAFMTDFLVDSMCMHIQSSLHDRLFWQVSCVCIFSQAFMTDFSGRFHVYAYSIKP